MTDNVTKMSACQNIPSAHPYPDAETETSGYI